MATTVEQLIVQMDADITRMSTKLDKAVAQNKKAKADIASAWTGQGGMAAIEKAFDSLGDAAGEAASKIPGLGAALGVLGPAGIAAAGAITAVLGAMEESKAALEFTSNLSKQADALHVTTDTLQEYQQALRLAGGDQTQVASSLQSFTEFLGKAEAGMPRAIKVFQELFGASFTKDSVKNLGGVQGALDAIKGKLQDLDAEQKEAFLSQTGLTGMKQLLEDSSGTLDELTSKTKDLGLVMDANLVAKGRELNEQLETATQQLNVEMKQAFVDIGPVIVGLIKLVAELVGQLSRSRTAPPSR
jgi:hypothetical protein